MGVLGGMWGYLQVVPSQVRHGLAVQISHKLSTAADSRGDRGDPPEGNDYQSVVMMNGGGLRLLFQFLVYLLPR